MLFYAIQNRDRTLLEKKNVFYIKRMTLLTLLLLALSTVDGASSYNVEWVVDLGSAVVNGGTLAITTDDTVNLVWTGSHNVYMSNGTCAEHATLQAFKAAPGYVTIESSYPDQNPYSLSIPSVSSVTEYCVACISHYSTMKFTLQVSPSVSNIVCIDDTVRVKLDDDSYVALRDVRLGDRLATPSGETVVRNIVRQQAHDITWSVPAGTCGASAPTILSPSHAIRCKGVWKSVEEVGVKDVATVRTVAYVNLLTDDYCSDMLLLDTGLVVETWDGRAHDEWRPHSYEDGVRKNCKVVATAKSRPND